MLALANGEIGLADPSGQVIGFTFVNAGIGTLNDLALIEDGYVAVSHAGTDAAVAVYRYDPGASTFSPVSSFAIGDGSRFVRPFLAMDKSD